MSATYDSIPDLAAALRRAGDAHGRHEVTLEHADPGWPDCYAQLIVDEKSAHPDRRQPEART
jgi:hypothetical protein